MAIHIVTSRFFLACEKVLSVKIEEFLANPEAQKALKKAIKKKGVKKTPVKKVEPKYEYSITITYNPVVPNGQAHNYDTGEYCLSINIRDKDKAHATYAEILKEVQEQHPNEGYLDKLVNQMLASDEFTIKTPSDN